MTWANFFKLGLLGGELTFDCQVSDIEVSEGNIQLEQRNLSGKLYRSYLSQNTPTISLSLMRVSDELLSILRGFQASLAPLNFIFNSSLAVKYLSATSTTTTTITIPLTSATGVVITGVYLQSDPTQAGTNYLGSGTFDAATGIISGITALPGANTDVFVNYTFTGISAWAKFTAKPHRGVSANYWQGTLTLTGA